MNEESKTKCLSELEAAKKGYFTPSLDWYDRHRQRSVFMYRLMGVVTILAGLAIPTVTLIKPANELILPLLSFAVAAGTSLSGFFAWQSSWQKCVTIQLLLEHAEAVWRVKIATAVNETEAARATTELFDTTKTILTGEAARWFRDGVDGGTAAWNSLSRTSRNNSVSWYVTS